MGMSNGLENNGRIDPIPRVVEGSRGGIRGYWALSALFAIAGFAVMPWDKMLGNPNNLESLPGDLTRIVTLCETFSHGFGVALVGAVIWVFSSADRKLIPRIAMCAIWPALGANLAKLLFARFRPIKYFDEFSQANFPSSIGDTFLGFMPVERFNTVYPAQSFPSAHAATVWGLAIGMTWAFPKGRWLFFGIALLASIQRVTSFAHWSSDVLWGISIAFLMGGALTHNWGLGLVLHRIELWASKKSNRKAEQGGLLVTNLVEGNQGSSEKIQPPPRAA